jgi:spermidine/putrescine transport system permease protein
LVVVPDMSEQSSILWRLVATLLVAFLLSPIILLVVFSFTSRGLTNFPIESLSFRWWEAMVTYDQFWPAFRNSMIVGLSVGVISAIIGTMAAIGLVSFPPRRASLAMGVLTLPVMLPPLVLAVALLSFFVSLGLKLGLITVIISHVLFTQPFVILIVHARLANFDYRIVESARDLGASPIWAFLTVTLPIIRPIVIGAALIAMALSIDDFVITFFTIGSGNTLPTLVWGMIRTGLTPTVNAIGTLILLLTLGSSLIALRLTRYRG